MKRRAFTLIELLVVVGVLLAIAAMVWPMYLPMLERRAFDAAVDEAVAQVAQARALAQGRGEAMEVVVAGGGLRLEVRPVNLLADADDEVPEEENFSVDGMAEGLRGSAGGRALAARHTQRIEALRSGAMGATGAAAVHSARHESWDAASADAERSGTLAAALVAPVVFADGLAASIEPPESADARPEFRTSVEGRVALFLPDGSAVAARGLWIASASRTVRVDIDPLLGRAQSREVALGAVRGDDDGEAEAWADDEPRAGGW